MVLINFFFVENSDFIDKIREKKNTYIFQHENITSDYDNNLPNAENELSISKKVTKTNAKDFTRIEKRVGIATRIKDREKNDGTQTKRLKRI